MFAQERVERTIRLTLAYDGTSFAGWQSQPNQRTVQETLEDALLQTTSESIRIFASGRTDSGVHALGQVVSFDTASVLPVDALLRATNSRLPPDVVVLSAEDAPPGFHALRDVVRKRYRYVIDDGPVPDVFRRAYAWHYRQQLDDRLMHQAAQAWVGRHDFSSFETQGSPRATSVRTVFEANVQRQQAPEQDRIFIEIEADGFLYNMVRAMVGTLVEVGRGARPVDWAAEVLRACDRHAAGPTAPPHGLFLLRVEYPLLPDRP